MRYKRQLPWQPWISPLSGRFETVRDLEDFGRGYSTLKSLKSLKWHVLKINPQAWWAANYCMFDHVCIVYCCLLLLFCNVFACLHAEEEPRGLVFFGLAFRSDTRHGKLALWEAAGQRFGQGSACWLRVGVESRTWTTSWIYEIQRAVCVT